MNTMTTMKALALSILIISTATLSAQKDITYSKALATKAAEGDADAQYKLAKCYLYGWGVEKSERAAGQLINQAIKNGSADAALWIATLFENGAEGIEKDYSEAYKYYMRAYEMGNEEGLKAALRLETTGVLPMGEAYADSAMYAEDEIADSIAAAGYLSDSLDYDPDTYSILLEESAKAGSIDAIYWLALCHRDGKGTPVNMALAGEWFERYAIAQQDPYSFWDAALCYAEALKYNDALRCILHASDIEDAWNDIGFIYDRLNNRTEARKWFMKAAARGNQTAKDNIALYDRQDKEAAEKRLQARQMEEKRKREEEEKERQRRQKAMQPESVLIYAGPYTQTGKSINNRGEYSDTGAPALHQVKIFTDKIIVNTTEIAKWKQEGDWYYYGQNEGEPRYLFNPKTFDLRWRFVFNFMGKQISDNFWVPGNQMALHQAGGYGRLPGTSGNNTSVPAGRHRCGRCGGTGDYPTDEGIPHFAGERKEYCAKCGTMKNAHWHKPCESCKGQGWW